MNKLNFLLLIALAAICGYLWWKPHPQVRVAPKAVEVPVVSGPEPVAAQQAPLVEELPPPPFGEPAPPPKKKKKLTLPFKIDDGVAVVQGDVVIGQPIHDNVENGVAMVPPLQLWPSRTIPYFIQPEVVNPERVKAALAMFDQTAVRFVEHHDQNDAIAFENGHGICKSYVGRVTGLQPIWIPPGCGPKEIAHEVMHALGFVHEQNRSDRDDFITVLFDNIEDQYKDNFEKLPQEYMAVSALAPFDFESLMIYPVWMFIKHGQATMESKVTDHAIQPGDQLSARDIERINKAYSSK